jgi:hypothetical protein
MNDNQRTVLIWSISAALLITIAILIFNFLQGHGSVFCPDGTTHPRIDPRDFQTQYSAYTISLEAKLDQHTTLSGQLGEQQLQRMSDAIQAARLHMLAVADGYNACAINPQQFNEARDRYQRMED